MFALADVVVDVGVVGAFVIVAAVAALVVVIARRGLLVRIRHDPPDDR